jgi:hypothetical protein
MPAIRVAQQHLGRSPVPAGERVLDGAGGGGWKPSASLVPTSGWISGSWLPGRSTTNR